MKWDLEERTEDALVAYLKAKCGDVRVSAAWERDEPQYPAVVVHVGATVPVSESADWHDARVLSVDVAVITEAAPELDSNNAVVRSARERNGLVRSAVMDALFTTGLLAALQVAGVDAVAFSMAQFVGTERTVADGKLVTTISGTVIAEPVTGS